jgi:hypothetical protein
MTMDCRADTSPAFERHARAKRARIDATDGLGTDIQAESQHFQHAIVAMSKSVEANASKVTTEVRTSRIISFVFSINHRRRLRNSPDQLKVIRSLLQNTLRLCEK